MATYFHGNPTELQAPDGLQTLVLMNPTTYVQQFTDSTPQQPHNNLIFLNPSSLSPHAPPPQHLLGIPTTTTTPTAQDDLHGLIPRIHYNLYNHHPNYQARDTPRSKQALSLSLSSHQHPNQTQAVSAEDMRVSGGSASSGSAVTNGVSGMQSLLVSSKFLKAAQELLDEVVNVNNNGNINKSDEFSKKGNNGNNNIGKEIGESSVAPGEGGDGTGKRPADLTTAERQEIQMKKAKLINMLDEVIIFIILI